MCWTGWSNARNIFNPTSQWSCAPGPWRTRSGPNAHALVQQCCVNVKRERGQTSTTPCNNQNVARKIWPFSNLIQHVTTYPSRVANRVQHVVPDNVAICWVEMLRTFGKARPARARARGPARPARAFYNLVLTIRKYPRSRQALFFLCSQMIKNSYSETLMHSIISKCTDILCLAAVGNARNDNNGELFL